MTRLPTFFAPEIDPALGEVRIEGEQYHHLRNVLRLKRNAAVVLTDGHRRFSGTVRRFERGHVTIEVGQVIAPWREGATIVLGQGIPKGKKMDWIVEKATEIGVHRIVPLEMRRSVPRYGTEERRQRRLRWRKVAEAACRQSGNALPEVAAPQPLEAFLSQPWEGLGLLLWEAEGLPPLREVLAAAEAPAEIRVIVGPEGGIAPEEAQAALRADYLAASLGPVVLRTETAALSLLAILQHRFGVLG